MRKYIDYRKLKKNPDLIDKHIKRVWIYFDPKKRMCNFQCEDICNHIEHGRSITVVEASHRLKNFVGVINPFKVF